MIEISDIDESYIELKINNDIEFGKKIIDTLSVFEESYRFNPLFKKGLWNGKKYFFSLEENKVFIIPKGLISYVIKDLEDNNKKYTYKKIIDNVKKVTESEFIKFIESLKLPFKPYDYQVNAALSVINEKRFVLRSATGCLDPESKINVEISDLTYEFLKKSY